MCVALWSARHARAAEDTAVGLPDGVSQLPDQASCCRPLVAGGSCNFGARAILEIFYLFINFGARTGGVSLFFQKVLPKRAK